MATANKTHQNALFRTVNASTVCTERCETMAAVPFFRECTRDLVKHMVGLSSRLTDTVSQPAKLITVILPPGYRLATNQPSVHLDTCTGIGILAPRCVSEAWCLLPNLAAGGQRAAAYQS